ncbi:toll/interleukin-1 receptor domain-containing protein [Catellatospora tritici]|uniref:toll/interleukin-1 receptor domain-containing protein n=1 Tax=Catellatospora tritici TaxID=2851566 RepID=UPI001C2CF1E8|nr:TIR domain-containing protein [Catellatospora tritici]MBV1855891.1 TIR domain-containing protein [Catellatospora tritici]
MTSSPSADRPTDLDAKYDAFISYSTASDDRRAPALRLALQRFGRPWFRRRSIRVFCAPTDLPATAQLQTTLEQNLAKSSYLVLLASEESAASDWVSKELAWWRANRRPETLLICLTGGRIVWNDRTRDFDWSQTNALPHLLRGYFTEEPNWVDLTGLPTDGSVPADRAGQQIYTKAIGTLAAPIRGIPVDELVGEDIRQHRRTVRLAWTVAVFLLVLAVAASVLGLVARDQATVAAAAQVRAEQEAAVSLSRYLASQAEADAGSAAQLSMLLSVAAWKAAPSAEAEATLLAQAGRWRDLKTIMVDPGGGSVLRMTASPGGDTMAAVMDDGRVVLWDRAAHTVRKVITTGIAVTGAVCYSKDGARLIVGGNDGALTMWDPRTGASLGRLQVDGYNADIMSLTAIDDELIAAGDNKAKVIVWNTRTQEPHALLNGHHGVVTGLGYSASQDLLVSVASDATVKLWRVGDEPQSQEDSLYTLPVPGDSEKDVPLAVSPNGRFVAAGAPDAGLGNVVVWDITTRQLVHRLTKVHYSGVRTISFLTDDGSWVVTGGGDNSVALWAVEEEQVLKQFDAHSAPITGIARADKSGLLYTASRDGSIIEWDILGDALVDGGVHAMTIDPEGTSVLTGHANGLVKSTALSGDGGTNEITLPDGRDVVDIAVGTPASGQRVQLAIATDTSVWLSYPDKPMTQLPDAPKEPVAIAFSHDGTALAAGGIDGRLTLWNTATRTAVRLGDKYLYGSVAFSPDGRLLAAGSGDGEITIWTTADRREVHRLRGHLNTPSSLAFSPDGTKLASAGLDGKALLWDTVTGKVVHVLSGHDIAASGAVFTADGKRLYTSDAGGKVIIWDVERGQYLARLSHPSNDPITDMAIAPDGRLILGYHRGEVLAWIADPQAAYKYLCQIGGRGFTDAEMTRYALKETLRNPCAAAP